MRNAWYFDFTKNLFVIFRIGWNCTSYYDIMFVKRGRWNKKIFSLINPGTLLPQKKSSTDIFFQLIEIDFGHISPETSRVVLGIVKLYLRLSKDEWTILDLIYEPFKTHSMKTYLASCWEFGPLQWITLSYYRNVQIDVSAFDFQSESRERVEGMSLRARCTQKKADKYCLRIRVNAIKREYDRLSVSTQYRVSHFGVNRNF